jgi:hypothetical protein
MIFIVLTSPIQHTRCGVLGKKAILTSIETDSSFVVPKGTESDRGPFDPRGSSSGGIDKVGSVPSPSPAW